MKSVRRTNRVVISTHVCLVVHIKLCHSTHNYHRQRGSPYYPSFHSANLHCAVGSYKMFTPLVLVTDQIQIMQHIHLACCLIISGSAPKTIITCPSLS